MGMYDNLICKHPLPDGYATRKCTFQTKDFECILQDIVIEEDGSLVVGEEKRPHFHGTIEFYHTNVVAIGKGFVSTEDNTDPWFREYTAFYTYGKLDKIEGGIKPDSYIGLKLVPRGEIHKYWANPDTT